jgi:hypothetical protein
LIARIDIRQEIQEQERLIFDSPTTEEAKKAWDRVAALIKNHEQLEQQARLTEAGLRFIEYLDDTIFH